MYRSLADYYDLFFMGFFQAHLDRTIRGMHLPAGARILEVGVGTGLSLSSYPRHTEVVGIDLSQDMLDQAARKHEGADWGHVKLEQMDAQKLEFPDESFDYVMAFHVLSVVPDPKQAMSEMVRVCRQGGQVVVVNHFRSRNRKLARFVDSLNPLTRRLGWRVDLQVEEVLHDMPVLVDRRKKLSGTSIFTQLTLTKVPAVSARAFTATKSFFSLQQREPLR
ncbi:MAG: methyltransferase domain-containing protein [Planctomycetales bacterium]|nr:methyltransferase domain-containing protein [Planctomycetales bacterium]